MPLLYIYIIVYITHSYTHTHTHHTNFLFFFTPPFQPARGTMRLLSSLAHRLWDKSGGELLDALYTLSLEQGDSAAKGTVLCAVCYVLCAVCCAVCSV